MFSPKSPLGGSYFQFPLCALAYEQSVLERLNSIVHYCLLEKGSILFRKLLPAQQQQFIFAARAAKRIPDGCDIENLDHCGALYGAELIGVKLGSFRQALKQHKLLSAYIWAFEMAHGRDAQVRIKKEWLFNTRDGRGMTYREFATLCAIFSVIGEKELVAATRDRIRRRALGYRTAAIMKAEICKRKDKAQPLTERQLRDTVARLHHNKFFARSTFARRITYYSIRLNSEDLEKAIWNRRTYPAFFRATRSARDEALTASIKKTLASLKSAPPTPLIVSEDADNQ